ncbi:MAG: diguanylate cyclase [Treponema sp.]|nr:diguanylate cyclase [Treponema sp.]
MEAHERRTVYSNALNKSLEVFVSYTEKAIDDVMSNGLLLIAEAANLDRIIIFRIFGLESNNAGEIYRWDKVLGGTAPIDPDLKTLPITPVMKRWISTVVNDTCISLKRSNFTEDEAAFLSSRGVKSILIVPVFVEHELWGVVTFHDNTNERDFDEDCTGFLRSAARLCAVTIMREEKTKAVDQAMEELKRHEKMKDILHKASAIFLSQCGEIFEDIMTAGISLIADAVSVDRMVLYRNRMKLDGLHMSQVYRWDRELGGKTELIESYADIPYARLILNWEASLANGIFLNSPSRLLPEVQSSVLQSFGIVSVAVIPVFINNGFWGFALFGDVRNERYFENDTIEMMRSAAFLFANAFIRTEMEHELVDKNELNRVMFQTAPIGLTTYNEDLHLVDCNDAVLNMHGVEKQYYLDHFLDFSPEYQPDGRKTIDKLPDIMLRALNGEKLVCEWMHKTLAGDPVPCELVLTRTKSKGKYFGLGYVYDLRNIKALEKNIQQLETEVDKIYYDQLTGIYNRRFFDENLDNLIKLLSRSNSTISLMMIDIDYFKKYNDCYGHISGDNCLRTIAKILASTLSRIDDFVVRYGGEEFVVVLQNTGESGARVIAETLLENVRNCNIPHEQSDVANCVTISIGLMSCKVEHTHCKEDYVQCADEQLYMSKQNGRNRYTITSL